MSKPTSKYEISIYKIKDFQIENTDFIPYIPHSIQPQALPLQLIV